MTHLSSVFRLAAILMVVGICSCRPLTTNEFAYLDTLYHPGTARNKVDLQSIKIWSLASSQARAIREANEQVRSEIAGGDINLTRANVTEQQLADAIDTLVRGSSNEARRNASLTRGMTIGSAIYFSNYQSDYSVIGQDLALLAHEVMHVWQWQNRQLTGYSLTKVLLEHIKFSFSDKVYDYEIVPGKPFLAYRYEQQGKIVEDYVFSALPGNPNKGLGRLISQALDAEQLIDAVRGLRTRSPARS